MDDDAPEALHPIEKAYEVIVAGSPLTGTTTQPKATNTTPEDAITPPLPLESLAALSAISSVRGSCIEAIARNVVGLGYDVKPRKHGVAAADLEERREELVATLEGLAKRDARLGRPSFCEQLFAVKTDEEEVGIGTLEVSRNVTTGKIDGLFHLPGKRMRRLTDQSGWKLVGETGELDKTVRFYNFGEKQVYVPDADGVPQPTNERVAGREAGVNEVLVFRLYTSESRDYGLPRDHALALEYAADKLAAESNVSFFDSSSVPPTLIFVSGEESRNGERTTVNVPQQTIDRINSTVKSDSGHKRAVAVIPLPAGAKVDKVALAQRSDRDIGNNEFRAAIAGRTLGAFRLAPIFVPGVAVDEGGRYTAEVQRALTLEQLFDPEQTKYEGVLDAVLRDLGFADLRVDFNQLKVEGDASKRESANALTLTRTITNREQRAAHGFGPLPEHTSDDEDEAAKAGKVPKGWNDALVTSPKEAAVDPKPYGGANDGPDAPTADGRGLEPGKGARRRVRQEVGDDGQPLAKAHAGVDFVDDEVHELEIEYLDLTDDGIERAMKRTHSIAEVMGGVVARELAERQAELDGAAR